MGQEYTKMFHVHLSCIVHAGLVATGLLWPFQ
jgi:hypothetical protein